MKINKKVIAGLGIAIALTAGITVNSQKLGGGSKNENYSEALNVDFTDKVSTYNKDKFKILAPGEQFWDGLTPEEKSDKVLVVPKYKKDANGNTDYQHYENLVIEKKDKNGNGINGIQFCIAKDPKDITQGCDANYPYKNWITEKDGKLEIPTNELPLYNQTLIETGETAKNYKPQKIDLYVDPGNRFLGEVAGTDFITYNELLSKITDIPEATIKKKEGATSYFDGLWYTRKIADNKVNNVDLGRVLYKGNDSLTGGNWLKIFDVRKGTTLYIAKKPLTNGVSWNQLCSAGVVFGLDQVNADETLKPHFKTPAFCGGTYKPKIIKINEKQYIVRLLRGKNTADPNTPSSSYKGLKVTGGSEWNRYILPLVKENRYGRESKDNVEPELTAYEVVGNFRIQLARYKWNEDLSLDSAYYSWTQEYSSSTDSRAFRGSNAIWDGAAYASGHYPHISEGTFVFHPVLEEIH